MTLFFLSACAEPPRKPAPVLHLGLHSDSKTGAMIVGEEDTLWGISQRYRLSVRDIIDVNGLSPPYALAPGRRLKLPPPVDYRAREGDTLQSIANMFGVGVYRLARLNGMQAPYALRSGQVLRVPSSLRRQEEAASKPEESAAAPPSVTLPAVSRVSREPLPVATTLRESRRPDFIWPVRGKVVSGYGAKEGGLYNDGINIAAPKGSPVAAAAAGVVAYVGDDLGSYGNLVLIRHAGGMMTAYAHMSSIRVKKGARVRKGQAIGAVGSTGSVAASQLHFEIRKGAQTYDPRRYLG